MFRTTRIWTVEWGDCDPAGIVFYPRFFAAFDTSTSRMIEQAADIRQSDLFTAEGIVG